MQIPFFKFFLLGFSLLHLGSLLNLIINSKIGPCVTTLLRVLMTDGDAMSQLMEQLISRYRLLLRVTMVCLSSSRQTQWDPPTWDSPGDDASLEHEAEMDLGTPTYDENPMKVSTGVSERNSALTSLGQTMGIILCCRVGAVNAGAVVGVGTDLGG